MDEIMGKKIRSGIDLVEIRRIKQLEEKYGRVFLQRIFSEYELEIMTAKWRHLKLMTTAEAIQSKRISSTNAGRYYEYLAGRFAAKEAVAKALGCGIGRCLKWRDCQIVADVNSQPRVKWYNIEDLRKKILQTVDLNNIEINLSITHEKNYALAMCVIYVEEENYEKY